MLTGVLYFVLAAVLLWFARFVSLGLPRQAFLMFVLILSGAISGYVAGVFVGVVFMIAEVVGKLFRR